MKPITQFKPKMFLQRDEYATLAWAGKLVLVEGWDRSEAILMACNYYGIDDTEQMEKLLDKFINEEAFTLVQIPNRLNGQAISRYLKDKFG